METTHEPVMRGGAKSGAKAREGIPAAYLLRQLASCWRDGKRSQKQAPDGIALIHSVYAPIRKRAQTGPDPGSGPRLLWGSLVILFAAWMQAETDRGVIPPADFINVNAGVIPDINGE